MDQLESCLDEVKQKITERERENFLARGFQVVSRQDVNVKDLYLENRPEWWLPEFFINIGCDPALTICNSPFDEFYGLYQQKGAVWLTLFYKKTQYYKFQRHIADLGVRRNFVTGELEQFQLSEKKILQKVHTFCRLCRSIKRLGYMKGPFRDRFIIAIEEFGFTGKQTYRIFSGHHRAGILAARGESVIPVVVLRSSKCANGLQQRPVE